ncbi:hypothetical protein [Sphingomonas sp. M1A8_2b]
MFDKVIKNRAIPALLLLLSIAMVIWQNWPAPVKPALAEISEQWRPELSTVQSISEALPIVAVYISQQVGTHDERVVRGIDAFVRDRFVHGFSYIAARDNWLLKSTFGMISDTYRSPVDVDDILRHRRAICSQQSIIFMELLRRYGLSYGAVLFAWPDPDPTYHGHFAVAARVDGHWRYYDSDLEATGSPLVQSVIDGSAIAETYPNNPRLIERMTYAAAHGGIALAHVNTYAAPRGKLLQDFTYAISKVMPFLLAALALILFVMQRKHLRRSTPRH